MAILPLLSSASCQYQYQLQDALLAGSSYSSPSPTDSDLSAYGLPPQSSASVLCYWCGCE